MSTLFKKVLPSLTKKTHHIYDDHDQEAISDFNVFIINKAFMQHQETLMYAAMMNICPNLTDRMVYDFYYYGVPKGNRFSKWTKPEKIENLDYVEKYFNISSRIAKDYLKVLTKEQIKEIKEYIDERTIPQ